MSYEVYKIVHILGIAMIVISFGAIIFHQMAEKGAALPRKRFVMITHGVGMFLALLGGFGLLARIGLVGSWPLWVWLKLAIWLVLGGGVALVLRKPRLATINWFAVLTLVVLAAYFANYKP